MKDNITILLKSIQWIDDDKTETELITKARYQKNGDKIKISYDDTSATGFEGSVTDIEVADFSLSRHNAPTFPVPSSELR